MYSVRKHLCSRFLIFRLLVANPLQILEYEMVNFMGEIEKGKGNSLDKLKKLLESAPDRAMRAATALVDTVIYEVQVRLVQGVVQLLSCNICLLAIFVAQGLSRHCSAHCMSGLVVLMRPARSPLQFLRMGCYSRLAGCCPAKFCSNA